MCHAGQNVATCDDMHMNGSMAKLGRSPLTHRNGTQPLPRFGNPPSANFLYRALRGVDHTAYHDLTPGTRLRSVVGTRRRRGMAMGRDQLKQLEQPQLPPRQTKGALPSTAATNGRALPSVEP